MVCFKNQNLRLWFPFPDTIKNKTDSMKISMAHNYFPIP
jgi:hypothetical protein